MESLLEKLTDWLKDMLVGGIMDNLTSTFSTLNQKIGEVTAQVAQTPDQFQPTVYNLIRNLSENVILPIAGIILTFIACYELIQLVIAHNNLANFETWIFFKWVFKTFCAVLIVTNTWNIIMGIFDVPGLKGKEYIALIPDDDTDDVYINGYRENSEEEFELIDIEDDAEFEKVVEEFDKITAEE